jgi:hypothetical protein
MLFSVRDMDILRLLRWCRFILPEDLSRCFSEAEIHNLIAAGLLKTHSKSGALILTVNGNRLLDRAFSKILPDIPLSYSEKDIRRRLRVARLTLTSYKAGLDVFSDDITGLANDSTFFMPSVMRGRGKNPWGNTRIAALANTGGTVYGIHSVCTDAGKLALADELRAFTNNTGFITDSPRAIIFAGESYSALADELVCAKDEFGKRIVSYGEAYRRITVPVHLLSCDDVGAKQLRVMSQPDYRVKLVRAALPWDYLPPPASGADCDGIFEGAPLLMAADMDLRRVDAAYELQKSRGNKRIGLLVFKGQAESFFYKRYRDTGKARVFEITDDALREFFGGSPLTLCEPPDAPFIPSKGVTLRVPPIQGYRKA